MESTTSPSPSRIRWNEVQRENGVLVLYHRTSPHGANSILQDGFCDTTGSYGMPMELTGVWLSNYPLDIDEGTAEGPLLRVLLQADDAEIEPYEVVEDIKTYREWCVPAALVNVRAVVEVVDEDAGPFLVVTHRNGIEWTF